MSGPATIRNIILADTSLVQVSASALSYLPEFEADASEHWIFDKGDASGLVGRVNGLSLTPVTGANSVRGFTVDNGGSGYVSAPTVTLTGGGGAGATAVAIISGGAVVSVVPTSPGAGYTSAPTVSFSGGSGTGGAATALLDGRPTYNANSLQTPDGGLNGLKTPWDDSQVMTVCGVFQKKAVSGGLTGRVVMGSGSQSGDGGALVNWTTSQMQFRVRNGGANTAITGHGNVSVDQWYFFAQVSNNGEHRFWIGGETAVTQTQVKDLAARKFGIGNCYVAGTTGSTSWVQGLNASELIGYNGLAKDQTQLAEIYARTKVRMARRGLVLH